VTPDQIVGTLQNDGVTLRAVRGRISLTPKRAVRDRHKALVATKRAEVLALLERYPGGEATARVVLTHENGTLAAEGFVPRVDERAVEHARRPRVILGRGRR
jgi:hypothetical protein